MSKVVPFAGGLEGLKTLMSLYIQTQETDERRRLEAALSYGPKLGLVDTFFAAVYPFLPNAFVRPKNVTCIDTTEYDQYHSLGPQCTQKVEI